MNLKKLFMRSWYYYRTGHSIYLSYPLLIVSFSSTVYYLAISNIPFLTKIFPRFIYFIIPLFVTVYPIGAILGWFHYRKSGFYKAEQDILVESSPYTTDKFSPISIPANMLFARIAREKGHDDIAEQLERILKKSV